MLNHFKTATLALLLGAALPPLASAQGRPIELGIDALSFGVDIVSIPFGDTRTLTTLTGPVKTFRAGFFVSDRASIEPRIDFDYIKPEGGDAITNVGLSLGGLYHFTPGRELSQIYVRPVGSIRFIDAGFASASQVSLGVGLGAKLPMLGQLAGRVEFQYDHGFENDDFNSVNSFAAVLGFSFFTQ